MGLSPRVRGNLAAEANEWLARRSIPARAGEPLEARISSVADKVYPRACGGTRADFKCRCILAGLSPRVRGNRVWGNALVEIERSIPARAGNRRQTISRTSARGSIPARAGEPQRRLRLTCPPGVYPRACGGTYASEWAVEQEMGLSPRVRGNRRLSAAFYLKSGSIPARAGEPSSSCAGTLLLKVYPRACGGTSA